MDDSRNRTKPVIIQLAVIVFTVFLSCVYPVYDGDVDFLEEQQSVWQYLRVFSIYQDRVPASCGDLSPNEMFNIINDTLKGGRYTGYRSSLSGGGGGGANCPLFDSETQNLYIDSITPSTVCVSITEFTDEAWKLFEVQAPYLAKFQNIVIDLWDNGGGLLSAVENMLGELLPFNTEFIQYRYREYDDEALKGFTVEGERRRTANRNPKLKGKNIAVLMNGGSASASEIMASALRDRAGAPLIGERSYGKGIGQLVISRTGRSVLSVTHMEISGVSERTGSYHRIGLEPDTVPEEYVNAVDSAACTRASTLALAIKDYLERECPKYPITTAWLKSLEESYSTYYRNLYCAIKTVEPSYTPPSPQMEKAAKERQASSIKPALTERALVRALNMDRVPVGVYVISKPDPLGLVR